MLKQERRKKKKSFRRKSTKKIFSWNETHNIYFVRRFLWTEVKQITEFEIESYVEVDFGSSFLVALQTLIPWILYTYYIHEAYSNLRWKASHGSISIMRYSWHIFFLHIPFENVKCRTSTIALYVIRCFGNRCWNLNGIYFLFLKRNKNKMPALAIKCHKDS